MTKSLDKGGTQALGLFRALIGGRDRSPSDVAVTLADMAMNAPKASQLSPALMVIEIVPTELVSPEMETMARRLGTVRMYYRLFLLDWAMFQIVNDDRVQKALREAYLSTLQWSVPIPRAVSYDRVSGVMG